MMEDLELNDVNTPKPIYDGRLHYQKNLNNLIENIQLAQLSDNYGLCIKLIKIVAYYIKKWVNNKEYDKLIQEWNCINKTYSIIKLNTIKCDVNDLEQIHDKIDELAGKLIYLASPLLMQSSSNEMDMSEKGFFEASDL